VTAAERGCIVNSAAMPWLADTEVGAAYGFARSIVGARTEAELRRRAQQALAELVPADLVTWDRVELATGAVHHEAAPADAESRGAFASLVGNAADHPLLAAHASRRRPALRMSEVMQPGALARSALYGDVLHSAGVEYEIAIGMRAGRGETVVAALGRTEREFSERERDMLDLARPALEGALRATQARGRLVRALADDPPPGTAVMLLDHDGEIELSSPNARRWLAEHYAAADHPGWLPKAVAEWLALPPRPPLVSEREGRRLSVCLLPGDPHALLLEETVATFRPDALDRLGLTARETEVLRAATVIEDETELAWELFLSLHAVRERLARLEAKLGVRTSADAVARALRDSA
jgi:DNA-binding CsgD family transcriptional regulator